MYQFELFEQRVKIKLISNQGFRTFDLIPLDVKEFVLKQTKKLGLWLYVDGIQFNPARIKDDIISSAKEIILTRPLVGG
jgi:hypothetical protein